MAPEQFRSLRLADTRSDIFSFGAMLYEMLTGVQLFAPLNAAEMAQLAAPFPDAHEMNRAVPPELWAIIARCLEYDPARRYQSFEDLHAGLSHVNDTLPAKLPVPTDEQYAARAPLLTPSLAIVAETYSLISLGSWDEAEEIARHAPMNTNFQDINEQYQIQLSTNAIFVHPFGAWLDLGYVMFLYGGNLYYVNVAPDVQMVTSLYKRTDALSHMAKILIVLKDQIGTGRKTCLISLEGELKHRSA